MAGRKTSRRGKEKEVIVPSDSSGSEQDKRAKKRKGKEVAGFSPDVAGSSRAKKAKAECHDSTIGLLQLPAASAGFRPIPRRVERQARDASPPLAPSPSLPSASAPPPGFPPLAPAPGFAPVAPPPGFASTSYFRRPVKQEPSEPIPIPPPGFAPRPVIPPRVAALLRQLKPGDPRPGWETLTTGPSPFVRRFLAMPVPVKLEPRDPTPIPSPAPPQTPMPSPALPQTLLRPVKQEWADSIPPPETLLRRVRQEPTVSIPPGFEGRNPAAFASASHRAGIRQASPGVLRPVLSESSDENPDGLTLPAFAVAHTASGERSEAPLLVKRARPDEDDELASTASLGDRELEDTASSAAEVSRAAQPGPSKRRYFLRSHGPADSFGDNFTAKYRI